MARCPNGHEQRLGLKCSACGADLSYRDSLDELKALPKVEPSYGKVSLVSVGFPRMSLPGDYVGEVSVGPADLQTSTAFQVATIRGGTWLDFTGKHLDALRRWMAVVGVERSTDRFVVVDTTDPLSVLALSALPKAEHTAVVAVAADEDSTPMEQNTSYVALSLALKRGLPVVALSESFAKGLLFFTEDRGFAAGAAAIARLMEPLLSSADDLMDLLERDLKLGIRMHGLSAVVAGSRAVYGTAANAFVAQSYNISLGSALSDYQTVHSMAYSSRQDEAEFEKGFGTFRNRRFRSALSAEFRFHESPSPLYDLVTVYGMKTDVALQAIAAGYQAIVANVPGLSAEGVS
ncbi:MAG: hypothetical protein JRM86_05055 [Nitrososphaerota archaeon]|nr:hypothetical protein [Nitrososphaerota archaeon]MDG6966456.1 hypothetical protein [Nitrososphaerota archaeon]MDG6979148.1 hypothetical protein [Nitrososphaerota archaeon]MDG7006283.1 hypothetical protein [Nitrososphaerota archaeon]MDG7020868.1 hypothetical protein [Nitrososphaerota archaeon]